ncbi:MAG: LysR family transcriptional regulator [Rhodospirillales bacterium]|nr:LysR family transcriptional regulator [Rhodospirillales bacterium]
MRHNIVAKIAKTMLTLNALRCFTATVEAGGFSAAGRNLGVAPSSVSRQISALEDSVGAQLLLRTTRKLSLTEAGRLYHQRVAHILADLDEATTAVSDLERAPRGVLHVNAPIAFGTRHIVPATPAFLARFPEVRIELTLTDNFVDLLEVGADVAVRVGELEDSSLIARRLAANRRILCASPDYLAGAGTPDRSSDLIAHNCLVYTRHQGSVDWNLEGPDGPKEVRVTGSLRTNNTEALHAAALGGLGIVLLPSWLVGHEVQSGRLVQILGHYRASPSALDTSIYALYPANRHLSSKVRAFVDFLVERFSPAPYWEEAPG